MKPYRKTDSYTLYLDDAWAVLDSLAENSIDAIVTDPPYEIGFMNKGWDNTGVAFDKQTWQKALRVLKPGGHLLAFNHSRTFHRMAVAIEDAGFEIRDTIMWLYGSGFPKSHDISKAIDRSKGENQNRQLKFTQWMRKSGLSPAKAKSILFDAGLTTELSNQASHYFAQTIGSQPSIATADMFDALRPHLPEVPEEIDRLVAERTGIEWTAYKNRKVVGKKNWSNSLHHFIPGENHTERVNLNITTAATDEAKKWEGWGTALKPAYEPILLARKPIPTTVADNVLQYGTGAINIDGCRVGTDEVLSIGSNNHKNAKVFNHSQQIDSQQHNLGRFPANVIHDGSEEVTQGFPDTVSAKRNQSQNKVTEYTNTYTPSQSDYREDNTYGDEGSASRFFYTAKTSKKDRDDGLLREAVKVNDGRKTEIDNAFQRGETPRQNIHPTVKPTDLMQYLIRLIAAPNATILDIFMGSGSTGKAAMIENAERDSNYHFIGIDRTAEYLPIAEARIEFGLHYMTEKPKADGVVHKDQIDIFTLL